LSPICVKSSPLSPMAGRGRLGEPRRWSTWANRVGREIGKSVRREAEAAAAEHGEPAVAVAAGPVAEAGDHQAARLHAGRAQGGHQELLHHQLPRRGRVRPRLQGLRRRSPPPGARAAARCRQVPRPRERRRPGAPRVAGTSRPIHHRTCPSLSIFSSRADESCL
jgi:hypothetical protein